MCSAQNNLIMEQQLAENNTTMDSPYKWMFRYYVCYYENSFYYKKMIFNLEKILFILISI